MIMLTSCLKPGKHEVRVNNESGDTLVNYTIFNISYGDNNPGEITEYKIAPKAYIARTAVTFCNGFNLSFIVRGVY